MSKKSEAGGEPKKRERKVVTVNRKGRFEYEILDRFEAGLVLQGTEVKALREGKATIEEAYAKIGDGEALILGMHIPEYDKGSYANHEPKRPRRLLLHKREIMKIGQKLAQRGLTVIPLSLYFSDRGHAKIELALAKGRKLHDKRDAIAEREGKKIVKEYEGGSRRRE